MTTHWKGYVVAKDGFKVGDNASSVEVLSGPDITNSTITVGTEASNVVNVAVQFKDAAGDNLARPVHCHLYFSDDAAGQTIATTAITTVAVGTDGVIMEAITAGKEYRVVSEADGAFDLDLTQAAADTLYMQIALPNELKTSSVITFT